MKKLIALLLSLIMIFTLCIPAYANENEYSEADIIGTLDSQTGTLVDDMEDIEIALLSIDQQLFKMTASGVTGLLTTYGVNGKSFRRSNIDSGTVTFYGTLTSYNTQNKPATIKAGVCYYVQSTNNFISLSGCYSHFTEGTFCIGRVSTSSLLSDKVYYGYINNVSTTGAQNNGSVSGSLTFLDSNRS